MSFDGTKPNLAQTYGDAVLAAQANDFDLNARVVAHVNDAATAHGLASVLTNVADYFLHKGNATDAHGLAAVLANVAAVMAEVAAGRGSLSSLALRLAAALNADGSIRLSTLNNKWINNADTPTYLSTTSFSVPGDRTAVYIAGVQCRFTISGSYAYGPVASRSFSAGVTTVVIDPAYPILTAGVSAVDIGLIAWDNSVAASCTTNATNITNVQGQVTSLKIEPIEGWISGKPGAGAVVHRLVAARAFSIPSAVAGATARASVLATAAASFTLSKISKGGVLVPAAFGTMDFSTQHTNLQIYSEQFDNGTWVKSNLTVTANTATAPDGAVTADTLTDADGADYGALVSTTLAASTSAAFTNSAYFAKDSTPKATRAVAMRMNFSGGTSAYVEIVLDTMTGETFARPAGTGAVLTDSSISDCGAYWRVSVSGYCSQVGISGVNTNIYPAVGSTSGPLSGIAFSSAKTGSVVAWGVQIEAGSSLSEYVATTSAAVTKYASTATFAAATSTAFEVGDTLVITAPVSQDATLADIAFTIPGVLP